MRSFSGLFFLLGGRKGDSGVQIIKKINTSAVLALDSNGKEIVVLGKGIGFPKVPYELTDLSVIDRTFYDVDLKYISMIAGLPQPILMASAEIAEQAEIELHCQLNPNLPFTLADHLNFAVERQKNGIDLTTPIAYDICHLYPREAELGSCALDILREVAGISLPENEAVNVAMHLINAEASSDDIHDLMETMQIITEVGQIVEQQMGVQLDTGSYGYSRFATHLRYLIQRLKSGQDADEGGSSMLRTIAREYPDVYACALKVADYFKSTWNWTCSREEILYLMLHINRVQGKDDLD